MAIYFGVDHVVWAQQAGIMNNKDLTARAQKWSLYGWFGGSLCTITGELYELAGEGVQVHQMKLVASAFRSQTWIAREMYQLAGEGGRWAQGRGRGAAGEWMGGFWRLAAHHRGKLYELAGEGVLIMLDGPEFYTVIVVVYESWPSCTSWCAGGGSCLTQPAPLVQCCA